jgi:fumarate reductase flavoprotein subunit
VAVHLHQTGRWPGHSVPRLHATPAESGAELSEMLRQAMGRSSRIMLDDGVDLVALTDDGAELSRAGTRLRVAADAVVLATGGFGASPALLARHAPGAAAAVHVGGRFSDGTALRVAAPLAPALGCMDAYQGQPHVSPHLRDGARPRFGASLPALGAIMVSRAGLRFADPWAAPARR